MSIAVVVQPVANAQTGGAPSASTVVEVPAVLETQSEFDDDAGGNADVDDPAIWVHPDDPDASLVIVTLKDAGLSVFTLDGQQIQRIAPPGAPGPGDAVGRFNNVDVLTDFDLDGEQVDIAVTTDRGRDQLRIFTIDPVEAAAGGSPLTDVTDPAVPFVFSRDQAEVNTKATAYGLSLYHDDDRAFALVSQELRSTLGSVELTAKGTKVTYRVLRTAALPTTFDLPDGTTFTPCQEPGEQPFSEGIFVDAEEDVAYVAQESIGLWRMAPDLADFRPELIDKVKEFGVPATFDAEADECVVSGPDPGFGGQHLSADVEGTTLFDAGDGEGYLLVSSQGNNTIAAYERDGDNAFVGSFRIVDGAAAVDPAAVDPAAVAPAAVDPAAVDSVEETDGMAVTNVPLGQFTEGLLVTQDGANTPDVEGGEGGEPRDNSNVKFTSWGAVAAAFDPPLDVNPDD